IGEQLPATPGIIFELHLRESTGGVGLPDREDESCPTAAAQGIQLPYRLKQPNWLLGHRPDLLRELSRYISAACSGETVVSNASGRSWQVTSRMGRRDPLITVTKDVPGAAAGSFHVMSIPSACSRWRDRSRSASSRSWRSIRSSRF